VHDLADVLVSSLYFRFSYATMLVTGTEKARGIGGACSLDTIACARDMEATGGEARAGVPASRFIRAAYDIATRGPCPPVEKFA
jgi:hypothetical protein